MKALQRVLILSVFIIPPAAAAQYTIPWASQQPAWVFPLWFEDGSGQKDTIYLGYDRDADKVFGEPDTTFGEGCYNPQGTFNALLGGCVWDTIGWKAEVLKEKTWLLFRINFLNATWPLTMKFDASLFYSDSLPFYADSTGYPDSLPRGYGSLYCLDPENNCLNSQPYPSFQIGEDPKDTFAWGPCNFPSVGAPCSTADSLVFYGDTAATSPDQMYISLTVLPYFIVLPGSGMNGSRPTIPQVSVYPNPASDMIIIDMQRADGETIELLDLTGSVCLRVHRVQTKQTVLQVGGLERGIYLLRVIGEKVNHISRIAIIR